MEQSLEIKGTDISMYKQNYEDTYWKSTTLISLKFCFQYVSDYGFSCYMYYCILRLFGAILNVEKKIVNSFF